MRHVTGTGGRHVLLQRQSRVKVVVQLLRGGLPSNNKALDRYSCRVLVHRRACGPAQKYCVSASEQPSCRMHIHLRTTMLQTNGLQGPIVRVHFSLTCCALSGVLIGFPVLCDGHASPALAPACAQLHHGAGGATGCYQVNYEHVASMKEKSTAGVHACDS